MPPKIRSTRERLRQTLAFEALGLALVTPLYSAAAHEGLDESFALLALLSAAVMLWSALFNTLFDLVEQLRWGRAASDRPQLVRVAHAALHEVTSVLVCCPLIYATTELSWSQALAADLGLSSGYAIYGYFFHLAYDRWRPAPGATSHSEVLGPRPHAASSRFGHTPTVATWTDAKREKLG